MLTVSHNKICEFVVTFNLIVCFPVNMDIW